MKKKRGEERRKGRTTSESLTLSSWANLTSLASSPIPLAARASCKAVTLMFWEVKARATERIRLPSDVASFSTMELGSRRQLSQCPHGVLSSAQEKSAEEKCLSPLSVPRFFFSGQWSFKRAWRTLTFGTLSDPSKTRSCCGPLRAVREPVKACERTTPYLAAANPYRPSYLPCAEHHEGDSIVYNLHPSRRVPHGQTLDRTSRAISRNVLPMSERF